MGLTVSEKNHWKERIARRIESRIDRLFALEANLQERINRTARERALASLGLAEMQQEVDDIERQKNAIEKRSSQLTTAMLAQVRGVPADEIENTVYSYARENEIRAAIERRQKVHEEELLAECDTGREVLRLRREQENLLDTVWLATSPAQVKELWAKVNELLSAEPSQLERDALAIKACEVE